jgi:integrase
MARIEWRTPAASIAVNVATVPSPDDVDDIVELVASLQSGGARYAALFAAVGMAGMRPSEAIGLRVADLELPPVGWGMAIVRGALTSPGTRYTANGAVVETKGLKQRPVDAVRHVPLAPALVDRLRWHLAAWEPVDGRVFTNAIGRPFTATGYGPVWIRARTQLWPAGHAMSKARVYDLRHSAATMMLRAGVPAAEVARRLGHSVDVLMRVYAGVFEDERDRSNELIEAALASKRLRRTSAAK